MYSYSGIGSIECTLRLVLVVFVFEFRNNKVVPDNVPIPGPLNYGDVSGMPIGVLP